MNGPIHRYKLRIMPDPLSLIALGAAVGGASGKLVESTWALGEKWIASYFRDHRDAAVKQAEENAARFLADLAQRVKGLEERVLREEGSAERIAGALSNPDVAAILHASLIAAARTSEAARHDVLARAVAERIAAADDSLQALAANIAIEAVPRLSGQHLRTLALMAVIQTIRPPGLPLPDAHPADLELGECDRAEQQLLLEYIPWLRAAVADALPQVTPTDADYTHLASTGCLLVEQGTERDLGSTLLPWRGRIVHDSFLESYRNEFLNWMDTPTGRMLDMIWSCGLNHVSLTPAGILLGVAAFDQRRGTTSRIDWSSRYSMSSPRPKDIRIWDGSRIDRHFLKSLEQALKQGVDEYSRNPYADFGSLRKRSSG